MHQLQWVEVLRKAHERPAVFIGLQENAHLVPIMHLLGSVWHAKAFTSPQAATVTCSPTQYLIQCEAGLVFSPVEEIIDWENCAILFDALLQVVICVSSSSFDRTARRLEPSDPRSHAVGDFASPLYLADRGVLGIRTRAGLWCQAYERGWPTTAPVLLQTNSPVGLVYAAALSPEWFTGLPFTRQQMDAAVPRAAKPHVRLELRPTDDLIPERLLRPEDVQQWL